MSGAAGGVTINKEDLKATIRDYRETVLKPLNLDKSYNITGIRRRPEKNVFGDIDIVISFPGGDKKDLKQEFARHLEQIDKIPTIPHKKNLKYFIHGSIVTTLFPIVGKENQYVQIDNIVASSKDEGKFTYSMLDLPAQEQGLALGLAKTVFTELNDNQIDQLFKDLNIPQDTEKPGEGEEYDFNLNTSELSLRIVPIGQNGGREIWKSTNFNDIKTLLKSLGIDIEKDKFEDMIQIIKQFKNRRSIDRLKGMFTRNIRVGDAEVGRDKGIAKQKSIDTVSNLEEKYTPLVMSLIHPFIEDETIILEEQQPKIIAVFPGKFKPPHKDHIARIKAAASDADEVIVLISPKTEPGGEPKTKKEREKLTTRLEDEMPITSDQSLAIFKAANLPSNVKIMKSNDPSLPVPSPSPVAAAYELFINNPDQQYIGVFGKEEDFGRFGTVPQNTTIKNYDDSAGNLSATDLRTSLKNGKDISEFLPKGISSEEYKQALNLSPSLNEIRYAEPSKFDYPKQLKALTEYMLDKGMNIKPLPKVKFVEDDVENARDFFGKTAYYDPNQRVIVLYTMDRHPKDIMRSFAHEMIHHMQNCENRLGNIATQDTNEDGDLPKIEREAYEKGNMTFRNWTDTITEWIVDTSKYNYTPKLSNKIFSQLHELKVNEISLNPNNAVEIYGDLFGGEFKVGNIEYIYSIKNIPSPYKDGKLFYNIQFDEKNNNESSNEPTGNARENYIKILSTMYKILLDFVEQEKPEYIGISSLDKSGYGNIYNNLTKTNTLPGYSRKDTGLDFVSKSGEKGKFIVLKKSIIDRIDCDKCDHSWPIKDGGNDLYVCHKCGHDNTPKQLNEEEEDDGTLLYKSIFKPDINILVAFKNYENYKILKPLFNKYGYGFYSPEDKIIILNGERFINSDLDFRDFKFVEAHEITHLLLGHTGPYSEEDEMDADLGAYILLKNKKLSTDRLVNEFENRHGIPFTEELLERVKNRL